MKEKSLKKDANLSDKEKELQSLREKARKMMLRAQEKEKDFKNEEKEFKSVLEKGPKEKQSMMDKIMAKANAKAIAMKEEMRKKRNQNNDDNLLAFLRTSHKKGSNIYDLMDSNYQNENTSAMSTENCQLPIPEKTNENGSNLQDTTATATGTVPMKVEHSAISNGRMNNLADVANSNGTSPANGVNMHPQTLSAHTKYQREKEGKNSPRVVSAIPPIVVEVTDNTKETVQNINEDFQNLKYIDDNDDQTNINKTVEKQRLSPVPCEASAILKNKIELKNVKQFLPRSPSPHRKSDNESSRSKEKLQCRNI